MPKEVLDFFQQHLISSPYPTWDILYHIIDIRNQAKNRLLEELVLNALNALIDLIIEHPDQLDKKDKLYNLLSNIYVSEWCMNRVRDNIVPRLFDLKENRGLLDEGESLHKQNISSIAISCLRFFQFFCLRSYHAAFKHCCINTWSMSDNKLLENVT